ncbi:hypothetical protein EV127DRAFT_71382 [Xylaria flabelliformis]|nr:hypothetical protein EV127DRAFT_71382 [Xylaria flabelliformis]
MSSSTASLSSLLASLKCEVLETVHVSAFSSCSSSSSSLSSRSVAPVSSLSAGLPSETSVRSPEASGEVLFSATLVLNTWFTAGRTHYGIRTLSVMSKILESGRQITLGITYSGACSFKIEECGVFIDESVFRAHRVGRVEGDCPSMSVVRRKWRVEVSETIAYVFKGCSKAGIALKRFG